MVFIALGFLGLASLGAAIISSDGTGRVPAMGWNSWNEYGCNIHEDVFATVAKRLVTLGLKDLGYQYVNIDDCWSDKQRRRDANTKELIPDAQKFPNGINGTAELVHSLGLKLGIYSDAGLFDAKSPFLRSSAADRVLLLRNRH